jgi:hypothetical protein
LSNYTITYATGSNALTVNPAALTITPSNQTKTYGALGALGTTAFTTSGLVTANGDAVIGVALTSAGAAATASAGVYSITPSAASGSGLGNYTITYASVPTGLTVNPAPLTAIALTNTKVYDGTTTAAAMPVVTGTVYSGDIVTADETYVSANFGTGISLIPTVTINHPSNYVVTYVPSTTGVITPVQMTIIAGSGLVAGQTTSLPRGTSTIGEISAGSVLPVQTILPSQVTPPGIVPQIGMAGDSDSPNVVAVLSPVGTLDSVSSNISGVDNNGNTKIVDAAINAPGPINDTFSFSAANDLSVSDRVMIYVLPETTEGTLVGNTTTIPTVIVNDNDPQAASSRAGGGNGGSSNDCKSADASGAKATFRLPGGKQSFHFVDTSACVLMLFRNAGGAARK